MRSSTVAGKPGSAGRFDGRRHVGLCGRDPGPGASRRMGRRVDAVATTDIVSNPEEYFADDRPTLLVSFARSGNSPESVAATEFADRSLAQCHHLVLTCDKSGRLYEQHARSARSFVLLMPEATNDQGFAMTSSFTSMILAAWLVLDTVADSEELVGRLAKAAEGILATRREESNAWPPRATSG